MNAIKWMRGLKCPPWKLVSVAREVRALSLGQEVSFELVRRSTIGVADFLAKYKVDREHLGVYFL